MHWLSGHAIHSHSTDFSRGLSGSSHEHQYISELGMHPYWWGYYGVPLWHHAYLITPENNWWSGLFKTIRAKQTAICALQRYRIYSTEELQAQAGRIAKFMGSSLCGKSMLQMLGRWGKKMPSRNDRRVVDPVCCSWVSHHWGMIAMGRKPFFYRSCTKVDSSHSIKANGRSSVEHFT